MKLRKIFAALMLLVACSVMAQGMGPIPVDPAVRTGKLDNGLTYYVRHNDYPEHRVNFYIAQRVGSLQEEESQRGLAHFLEHMAFNGSDNYKGNGVIDYTRTLGVEFGRDLNAYTSIDQTVYNINDVPSTRQSALDSCLLILRDWSCGLLLEGDEIDKERGVIHEEWRLRSSAMQRMLERNLETLYPGSKYGKRMPIGLMSVVDNFKYDELRNYYKKWYHPENQCIIVVGDIDVDYTEGKIKEMFGPIKAGAHAAHVTPEAVPDNDQVIVVVDKDKEQQYDLVELCFKHEAVPDEVKGDVAYLLMDYMTSMMTDMLNKRLSEKAQEPDCPFIQAFGSDGTYIFSRPMDALTLYGVAKEGQAEATMKVLIEEARRAAEFGFTATEYSRARAEYLSKLEDRYNNRSKISNERYGRSYAANYLEKEPIPSIEKEYELMNMIAPNIPVDAINQILPELITKDEKNVVLQAYLNEKEGRAYPTVESVRASFEAGRATKLEAYVDNVKDEPLMSTLPTPGKIVKETENTKLGFKELTLSNGAKVILKKTDFKDDEIQYYAEAKGGNSLYDQKDWANFELYDALVGYSGLGEFDNKELEKALAGKKVNVNLSKGTYYDRLNGNSTIKDLETLFQLNYLYFTSIKKDEKSVASLMGLLETTLKNKGLTPEAVYSDSVSYTIGNHEWRSKPFNVEDLANVNYDRILEMAKESTADAGKFTFYFVGSFDEATIKGYIEQYIASLPATGKKSNYKNVSSTPKGEVLNHFKRKMETPKAMSRMYWSNTTLPYTLENSIKASIAGQLLDMVYLRKIREEASAAYSAGAFGNISFEGDDVVTNVVGVVPMKPEKADEALKIMREELARLGTQGSEEDLAKIKEVMLKDAETNAKKNGHWVSVLSMYVDRGIDIETDYTKIVKDIKITDITNWVRNYIILPGNKVEVVMMPEE